MTDATRLFYMIIQVFNHPFNQGLYLQFAYELQGWLLSQLFHLKFYQGAP